MRLRLAFFALTLALGAGNALARPCGFSASTRLAKPDGAGIRKATVAKEWRGMVEEFWVTFRLRGTFPHFTKASTPAAAELNRILRAYVA